METVLGLKANWRQFSLLVIVNAFVGGMIGLERSILPYLARDTFGISSQRAIFSFILVFGISKAISNFMTGHFANQLGRKNLLIVGWLFAIPIPFIFMWAPSWNWIIAANVLLGLNQGFAWSSTVTMKIDLVGERNRGLAMGINEFAGYLSVGLVAYLTSWIAGAYGMRPYPFYLGIILVMFGLFLTVFFIRDTRRHVQVASLASNFPRLKSIFWDTTWRNPNLGSVTQAGLINNMNDGMVWGLFPLLLFSKGFQLAEVGVIVAIYPIIWGVGQLGSGKLADIFKPKDLLVVGMFMQSIALFGFIFAYNFNHFVFISTLLGLGTALVYPTFLTSIARYTHPLDRAESVGIFRLWRDLGYALGALLTGILIDFFSNSTGILAVALLTLISAGVIWKRMKR
jgi:MFS family permease